MRTWGSPRNARYRVDLWISDGGWHVGCDARPEHGLRDVALHCARTHGRLDIAFGITALFLSVPYAASALGAVGAAYLFYLAWQAVKPGGRSPLEVRELPREQPRRLLAMGATTSLLNPKLAMIFLSLLPQFIDYQDGSVLRQSLVLGSSLIVAFASVNGFVAVCSGSMATFLARRPGLLLAQRWAMGAVLVTLGAHMTLDALKLGGIA
jgi:threonine/homoserine/homoserine lactone efflux protein